VYTARPTFSFFIYICLFRRS